MYNIKLKSVTETESTMDIPTFIGMLFHYRDRVHLIHLNTTSYAAHKALNSLYNIILDVVDSLAETAQTESLLNITIPESSTSNDLNIAQEILDFVRMNRYVFPHTFQQNEIDTLEASLSSAIYKLKFLK